MAIDKRRRRFTVEITPIGRRQVSCVARLTQSFAALALEGAAVIWVQNPIRLGKHSEPQPDFVLLRPRPDLYASVDPTPADILRLVDVADASVEYDHRVKLPLYAGAEIPES